MKVLLLIGVLVALVTAILLIARSKAPQTIEQPVFESPDISLPTPSSIATPIPTPKITATPKPKATPIVVSPTPAAAADLMVDRVMFIPISNKVEKIDMYPGNGETLTVDKTDGGYSFWPIFKNSGTLTARDVNITYYINGELKEKGFQSLLEPNTTKNDDKGNLKIPNQAGTTTEIRIVINEDKKIPESNYANNTHTFKYTIRN